MAVTRTNVDFAKRILADRVGNDYVYGGCWNPNDTSVGTDCSGLVVHICDAVRNGTAMTWTRHGMTTESWRPIEVGQTGTVFNTICVASPADFPPDAAVKIALHHGHGGGVNSHMWCEVDGVRGESNGSDGCVTGNRAMSVYDTSYANDWHYIPGPIGGGAPAAPKRDVYAQAIIREGQRRGVTPRGIQIALATVLVESDLVMYANQGDPDSLNYPHEALSTDANSVGLFQQRAPWWGTVADRMDPTRSAGLFYDALTKLDYNGPNSPGWYAQAVQKSAFPDRYDEHFSDAVALYSRLTIAPIPTPIPVPAPSTPGGFMSALSDSEQRELLDLARQQSGVQRISRSPLRHLGEGPTQTISGFEWSTDGSVHLLVVEALAALGHPPTLQLLNEVASADPGRYPDRQDDRKIAQAMLNRLAMGVGPQSAPVVVQQIPAAPPPDPTPAPVAQIAPVIELAPGVASPPSNGGDLYAEMSRLKDQIRSITTSLAALSDSFLGSK